MSIQIDRGEPAYEWDSRGDLVKRDAKPGRFSSENAQEGDLVKRYLEHLEAENASENTSGDPAVDTWKEAFDVSGRLDDSLARLEQRDTKSRTLQDLAERQAAELGEAIKAVSGNMIDESIIGMSERAFREQDRTVVRTFKSGATRDTDTEKYEYDGFLSPDVLHAFAGYMHSHRTMKDGSVRGSSNWKRGIPQDVYFKSLTRHFFDLWLMVENGQGEATRPDGELVELEDALGGLFFNLQGYWLGVIRGAGE